MDVNSVPSLQCVRSRHETPIGSSYRNYHAIALTIFCMLDLSEIKKRFSGDTESLIMSCRE